jgi:hypothetical protein
MLVCQMSAESLRPRNVTDLHTPPTLGISVPIKFRQLAFPDPGVLFRDRLIGRGGRHV